MKYHSRIDLNFCMLALLIAAMGISVCAQGRGGAAASSNFYRFNYSLDEMQPISYPAQPVVTQHRISLPKEIIDYTARVGFLPIRNATSGVIEGHLFYVYYAKDGVTDRPKRPVWFLFNGGPGAATIWLHMGAFGPKVVKMDSMGLGLAPPYSYVDNPNCLLDTGDLVFIDAMGTGFSRPAKPAYGPNFGGVENDVAAFAEFIRSFLNAYNLWGSPLFIGGESYGTTRAAGLAGYLTDRGIPVSGVMLLSAIFDSNAGAGEQRQLGVLTTAIMTAHYHKRLGRSCRSSAPRRWRTRPASSPRGNTWNTCLTARAPRRLSAKRCSPKWPVSPGFPRPSSPDTTCAWRSGRSARSCCASAT